MKIYLYSISQPSNIFFSLDGSVKVGDFGLVTAHTSENNLDTPIKGMATFKPNWTIRNIERDNWASHHLSLVVNYVLLERIRFLLLLESCFVGQRWDYQTAFFRYFFGICLDSLMDDTNHTSQVGTQLYMSPEQVKLLYSFSTFIEACL